MPDERELLAEFLEEAKRITRVAFTQEIQDRFYRDTPEGYVTTRQLMVFSADLVSRVQLITYCYDRLHELNPVGHEIDRKLIDEGRIDLSSPFVTGYSISKASMETREAHYRWVLETDAMTFLIYYELKSITSLLRQVQIHVRAGLELHYLIKVRDILVAHPQLKKLVRTPTPGSSIPFDEGAVQKNVASGRSDHIVHEFYRRHPHTTKSHRPRL